MKNEYIRRADAVDALAKTMPTPATPDGTGEFDHEIHIADEAFADAIRIIESLEPADIVTVVRCKDCQYLNNEDDEVGVCYHMNGFGGVMPKDGFCSKGERRT